MPTNRVLAVLIVAATVVFAVGVAIERSQESGSESGVEETHAEGAGGEGEAAEGGETQVSAEGAHSESSEKLLGIDPESVGLVIVAVLASLALAAAIWLRPDLGGLLLVTALAMFVLAALDVRELVHQLDESRTGLALLVAVVVLLHASAAVIAWRMSRPPAQIPPEADARMAA